MTLPIEDKSNIASGLATWQLVALTRISWYHHILEEQKGIDIYSQLLDTKLKVTTPQPSI